MSRKKFRRRKCAYRCQNGWDNQRPPSLVRLNGQRVGKSINYVTLRTWWKRSTCIWRLPIWRRAVATTCHVATTCGKYAWSGGTVPYIHVHVVQKKATGYRVDHVYTAWQSKFTQLMKLNCAIDTVLRSNQRCPLADEIDVGVFLFKSRKS